MGFTIDNVAELVREYLEYPIAEYEGDEFFIDPDYIATIVAKKVKEIQSMAEETLPDGITFSQWLADLDSANGSPDTHANTGGVLQVLAAGLRRGDSMVYEDLFPSDREEYLPKSPHILHPVRSATLEWCGTLDDDRKDALKTGLSDDDFYDDDNDECRLEFILYWRPVNTASWTGQPFSFAWETDDDLPIDMVVHGDTLDDLSIDTWTVWKSFDGLSVDMDLWYAQVATPDDLGDGEFMLAVKSPDRSVEGSIDVAIHRADPLDQPPVSTVFVQLDVH